MARVIDENVIDLIILDLKLAGQDGLQLVRDLRARSDMPIIIITGHRRDEVDRIVCLEFGADDYVTKPFNLRELLARVRAILRRAQAQRTAARADSKTTKYRFAGWELNLRLRRLTSPRGDSVGLTSGEQRPTFFLDETVTATNIAMAAGSRLVAAEPHGHWQTMTFVAGLWQTGIIAPLVLDGSMTGVAFLASRASPGAGASLVTS